MEYLICVICVCLQVIFERVCIFQSVSFFVDVDVGFCNDCPVRVFVDGISGVYTNKRDIFCF